MDFESLAQYSNQVLACVIQNGLCIFWKTAIHISGSFTKHSWSAGIWNIQMIVFDYFLGILAHRRSHQVRGCTQNSALHTLHMSRPSAPGGSDHICLLLKF